LPLVDLFSIGAGGVLAGVSVDSSPGGTLNPTGGGSVALEWGTPRS
jgi:hypothetical protein